MAKAFAQGTWDFSQKQDFVLSNFSGTGKHRDEILGKISADGLNESITDVSRWVNARITDAKATYWSLAAAKERLSQMIDASPFKKDTAYTNKMESELERLNKAMDEIKDRAQSGKDDLRSRRLQEFNSLESLYLHGGSINGHLVTADDLYAKYAQINGDPDLGSLAQDLWDRMNKNELYKSTLKNYDELMGRGPTSALMQSIRTVLSDQAIKKQLSQDALFPGDGDTISVQDQSRLDAMGTDILSRTLAWMRSGDYKDEGEIRDYVLGLTVPYLEHWSIIGETPQDNLIGGKNPGLEAYGNMVEEGELNRLSGYDPVLGTNVAPRGWEKAAELYRSRAIDLVGELSKKGKMPSFSDLRLVPTDEVNPATNQPYVNEGDLAFRPKDGKGMYFVDIINGKLAITYKADPATAYGRTVVK